MMFEIFNHLQSSPIGSRVMTYMRDDDKEPFSDSESSPVVIRQNSAPADRDVTQGSFDLWIFTKRKPSFSEINALLQEGNMLVNWLLVNYEFGRIGNIVVNSGVGGPFRDSQDRIFVTLSITVYRSSGG